MANNDAFEDICPTMLLEHLEHLRLSAESKQRELVKHDSELAELEQAGMVHASPFWQGGRYLYLIHPSKSGRARKRVYIGTNPEKQKAALAKVDRHRRYAAVRAKRDDIRQWTLRMSKVLEKLLRSTPGNPL